MQQCEKCQSEMQFREGISKKSGKAWAGWFCSDRKCGHVEWEQSSVKPQEASGGSSGEVLMALRKVYEICAENQSILNGINYKLTQKNDSQSDNPKTKEWPA